MDKNIVKTMLPIWPKLIEFQDNWGDDIDQGGKILERCGYRHTGNILKKEGFRIFANLGPEMLDATVTNMWLKMTRQDWFKNELQERFQKSTLLQLRWKIVETSWEAHRDSDYLLSVPVLFTQIEGILGDALILNNKAKNKKGRLYVLDSNGLIKKENGKQKELIGISAIIDQPYFKDNPRLEEIIKFLREDKIVDERNAILHGRKTSYGSAKLSTQSLLLIYVLIRDAAEFEPPIVITDPAPSNNLN